MEELRQPAPFAHAVRLFEAGDLDGAEALCLRILDARRKDVDALELRGAIALRRGRAREALRHLERCLALRAGDPSLHFLAGKAEAQDGRYEAAIKRFDEALRLRPGDPKATEWKALVLELSGAYRRAGATLRPFIESGRETPTMAEVQARVDLYEGRCEEARARLAAHLGRPGLAAEDRHRLGHVAGQACERLGLYDEAFAAHAAANRAVARPFDAAAFVRAIDGLIATFSRQTLPRLARHPRSGERHVFIAGMPRSGTTLIEQILDSHPEAVGVGEDPGLEEVARRAGASAPADPRGVLELRPDDLVRLAQRYTSRFSREAQAARRIVNKHLDNWKHLGVAAMVFPGAAAVHCRRHPLDVGLSCFTSDIMPAVHPWIGDLRHIGLVQLQCDRLMDHWKSVLDLRFLEVRYEDLVEDLQGGVRRLLEHCGLGWDERCLRFHESDRAVRTHSYGQVRRPIYRSSVGRWKPYEQHLRPLVEALGGAAAVSRRTAPSSTGEPHRGV
jgi:Flp pilus assembly protein TadD